ncbi:class I SAM-dependent methyltransferase [Luteitalea sp. TBR-22]|uniref:class I SAM-dependent methyltransferase n=1 Tax=Luteitalea sp. TBR-22 TaxID=2802971 RepID=UPI001AF31351|nr:class I SAM-dependent methyltransferase [Luteitalea sp. TBR-22]
MSQWLARRIESVLASRLNPEVPALGLRLADGDLRAIGQGDPLATIVIHSRRGLAALASMDATRIAEAYRAGAIDVEGSLQRILALREAFADRHPITDTWRFIRPLFFGQVNSDKKWIADHYERDGDFYTSFLDRRHRCYSQGLFASPDEPLEDAQTRKLDAAVEALGLGAGARVLDVGGGWGAFTEHGGRHGLHVTSLTISRASERFIQGIIDAQGLPCRVVREHLMEHESAEPYDGIVNLGVTEHLPDYPATLKKYQQLLKPGGFIYLDASAARVSHDYSAFLLRHLFPGNGTTLCLHKYLAAVADSPFEVLRVHNDRENYRLTTLHWARNLDAQKDFICERYGPETWRTFRLYLWGCVDGFERDMIQAYRWVLQLPR